MSTRVKPELVKARRVAGLAALVTLTLAVAKWLVGLLINSPALQADGVDSTTDTIALATSWVGLRIASREPTERFPYGFYRAESLAALVVSVLIIVLGGRYLWEGLRVFGEVPNLRHPYAGMATAVVSVAVAAVLYRWERNTSRETGSQSLSATAAEVKLDMAKSSAVFVALVCSRLEVPYVESLVTLAIAGTIIHAGVQNLRSAVLSLMDASVDPALEDEVARIIAAVPGVRGVEKIHSRRSGPFYFVEGHVDVKPSMDVECSHALAHRAAEAVRQERPRVEGVVLHIEPYRGETQTVLVPVETDEGLDAALCPHFGRAPYFVVARLNGEDIDTVTLEENEFRDRVIRAGLAVIREFVQERELDAVLVREIGEIAFHGLRDSAVGIFRAPETSAREAIEQYARNRLDLLPEPTHSSDRKIEDGQGATLPEVAADGEHEV